MSNDNEFFKEATKQEEIGNNSKAIELYNKALEENPGLVKALVNKTKLLVKLKEFQSALENIDEAIRIDSENSELYKMKARILNGIGEFENALKSYKIAIEMNPNDDEIWMDLGLLNFSAQNYAGAIESFDKALEINNNTFIPNFWKAKALVAQNKLEEALIFIEKASRITPDDYKVLLEKANLLLKLKRYPEAIQSADKVLNIKANSTEALLLKGYGLLLKEDYEKAIQVYDQALAIDPQLKNAKLNKEQAIRSLSDQKAPIDNLIKTLRSEPKNYIEWYNQSQNLTKIMNYNDALLCIEQSVKLNPAFAEGWMHKGLIHTGMDQPDLALEAYEEATSLKPNFAIAWSNKATTLMQLKNYEESIKSAEMAIKLDPLFPEPWISKSVCLIYLREYKKALKVINEGIKIARKSSKGPSILAVLYHNKATILKNLGKIKESEKYKEMANKLNPQLLSSKEKIQLVGDIPDHLKDKFEEFTQDFMKKYANLVNEGVSLSEKGDFAEALKNYDTALKIFSKEPRVWFNKGMTLKHMHREEEALTCFNKAIELDSKVEGFWEMKAAILVSLGKKEEAIKTLSKAIQLNPQFDRMKQFRESLINPPKRTPSKAQLREENSDVFFEGKHGNVILRSIGHSTIQITDSQGRKSNIIKLRYTGQPDIVIQEFVLIWKNATKENKMDDLSWTIKEYFKLFKDFEQLQLQYPVVIDNSVEPMMPEYEYSLKIGSEKWELTYSHQDIRKRFLNEFNVPPILIDYFNGRIIQNHNLFYQDSSKTNVITLQTTSPLSYLNNKLMRDKMLTIYSMMIGLSAFASSLRATKEPKALIDYYQQVLGMSRLFPELNSFSENYLKFFHQFFKDYFK